MPYEKPSDLPDDQFNQYDSKQKRAALQAFHSVLEDGGDESDAFAAAHTAAKKVYQD